MSLKSLKVTFGAEIVVFVIAAIVIGVEGFSWTSALLLLAVFLISCWTFYSLYKKLPKSRK